MMENLGLVSVVMPAYNAARFIGDSIQSVLNQTYPYWELIIVDDCSTDDTDSVVSKFLSDNRIRCLKNEVNSGAAISRNYALREAKGKWIAFLDCDDLWYPEKLEKQIAFMMEKGYRFTFTDYRIVMPDGSALPYVYTAPKKVTRRKLFQYCYFSTITVMYDREAVGLIQIADLKKNNDYAMWFEAAKKVDCYRLPQCYSVYCKRENSISSGSKLKLIRHHYILYRKGLNKSAVLSAILTVGNLFFGVIKKVVYKKRTNEGV